MALFWIACMIITVFLAAYKKLNLVLYFFLSLILGPIAVLIALLVSAKKTKTVQPAAEDSLAAAQMQLRDVKNSLSFLQNKILDLESKINQICAASDVAASKPEEHIASLSSSGEQLFSSPVQPGIAAASAELQEPEKIRDMEVDFGRFWLNRIGIVVFTLGIGFLISYTFRYFTPGIKIAFGYALSLALFFIGFKLEKQDKLVQFGRALLGGGWALVYFTTFAMHHFEASRLIASQAVDLCLLAVVVVGMIAHVSRYQSEGMMSVALFVAYLTSTIGNVTIFTVSSCLLLSLVVLYLVHQFQWVKTFILGIILTYGIHQLWVMPHVAISLRESMRLGILSSDYQQVMNFIFLSGYWLVFLVGAHIAQVQKGSAEEKTLAAVSFGNIAIYSVLAYPVILELFYSQRFFLVLGYSIIYVALALLAKNLGRRSLYLSNIVAGVFLATFAISLKFLPSTTLWLWLIEIPCLLLVSFQFQEKIFRSLGYALTVMTVLRLISLGIFGSLPDVRFLNYVWTWSEFSCLWAGVTMGASFAIVQWFKSAASREGLDEIADQFYSALAVFYLNCFMASIIHPPWLILALSLEGVILLFVSILGNWPRFRIYAYLLLLGMLGNFMIEPVAASTGIKVLIVGAAVVVFFAGYFLLKSWRTEKKIEPFFEQEEGFSYWLGILAVVVAVFQHIHPQWISLSLGTAGVLFILTGILTEDKVVRLGGLLLFFLTLGRVILVDLSGVDIIFKIITFIVLGILLVGVSYFYNQFNLEKNDNRKN